jgi:VanZ family protein
MHRTAATPLALIYVVLIVYASLYPFSDWRDQGVGLWDFMFAAPPKYWTTFDVAINMIGYIPMGGLLTLSALRTGRVKNAVLFSLLIASVLSLSMETLQGFLTTRVASREDWLLNSAGALLGAVLTLALERMGAINRWSRIRRMWFVDHSRGGLVLLATWPAALLFPPPVPFGLGQVFERLEIETADLLQDSPFIDWLPLRQFELQPLVPGLEMVCVVLGLLIPCLLGLSIVRTSGRRILFVPLLVGMGVLATTLSAGLSWGPGHAWAWMDLPTQIALLLALLLAPLFAAVPGRACAAIALLMLGVYLSLLNQAPESPYFAQTLQGWEQGRFIRFNGLAQWVGWLWPYAAMVYALVVVWRKDREN